MFLRGLDIRSTKLPDALSSTDTYRMNDLKVQLKFQIDPFHSTEPPKAIHWKNPLLK